MEVNHYKFFPWTTGGPHTTSVVNFALGRSVQIVLNGLNVSLGTNFVPPTTSTPAVAYQHAPTVLPVGSEHQASTDTYMGIESGGIIGYFEILSCSLQATRTKAQTVVSDRPLSQSIK
jgi:hypothetical protein